ncbi:MAG: hypothetical protein PHH54_05570 [Candidatus Nanoarchaeia archaeon]|nr:hypothetical protein [Candidatus Nanoarchaeia archaeon]MDD5741427.1 hypothetical protein [Candidatus Nanoarchaeia archaeon]
MMQKKASELKQGDIILVYGDKAIIKKVETSGKGIKQGKVKCRIEAEFMKDNKPIVIIRLAEDVMSVE